MTTSWEGRYKTAYDVYDLQDVAGNPLQDVFGRQLVVYGEYYAQDTHYLTRTTP